MSFALFLGYFFIAEAILLTLKVVGALIYNGHQRRKIQKEIASGALTITSIDEIIDELNGDKKTWN